MANAQLTAYLSNSDLRRIAQSYGLSAAELDKAAVRAVNDVAKTGRGRTRKAVRAHVTLPAKRVNKSVEILVRAKPSSMRAVIGIDAKGRRATGQTRRPTLMSFGGKPKKAEFSSKSAVKRKAMSKRERRRKRKLKRKPFTYQILKSGPRKTLAGGFVQEPGSASERNRSRRGGNLVTDAQGNAIGGGTVQAFVRKSGKAYPLIVPKGPSVAALWQSDDNDIAQDVLADINQTLPSRIQGQAQRIYDKRFHKRG